MLADSGIQSSASTKGVLTEIKAKNLIDIVAKKVDGTSKIDYDSINPQFMKKFIQCIIGRKDRFFKKFIPSGINKVDGNGIKKTIGSSNLSIFNTIIATNSYMKNGSACGRGEIALALFFNDCFLPDKKGDISLLDDDHSNMDIRSSAKKIEIKGKSACITKRISTDIPSDSIKHLSNNSLNYNMLKNIFNSIDSIDDGNSLEENDDIMNEDREKKKLDKPEKNKSKIGVSEKINTINDVKRIIYSTEFLSSSTYWKANLSSLIKKMSETNIKNKEQLMFAILFGCLWEHYKVEFDTMLIWDTDDFVDYNMVAINPPEGTDWYSNGLFVLKKLSELGLSL